jgi:chloramphenicol O-acetyltransferase
MRQFDRTKIKQHYYQRMELLLMPKRNDAVIFTTVKITAPKLYPYLAHHQLRIFPYLLYACLVSVNHHPTMKRFVLGGKLYEHKQLWVSTVVKRDKKNQSSNTFVKLELSPDDTPLMIQAMLDQVISDSRSNQQKANDYLMKALSILPNFLFKIVIQLATYLDNIDLLPNQLIKADPLHTNLIIANLGSINGQQVAHHLFNWGTCSLVITFGHFNSQGELEVTFSVDERIAEGVGFFQAIDTFKQVMENPDAFND